MDSPFPGMDPYLEEPSGWPGVHHRLISVLSDALTEQVAPHYTVSIEERVYITDDEPEARQQAAHHRFLAIYDRRWPSTQAHYVPKPPYLASTWYPQMTQISGLC